MKVRLFFAILTVCSSTFTLGQEISFQSLTFEQALEKSKEEQKDLFIDFHATWCRPCLWMDKKVFQDSSVGRLVNKHFISLKVDVEKEESALVNDLQISALPTFVFFSKNGEVIFRQEGSMEKDYFLKITSIISKRDEYLSQGKSLQLIDEEDPAVILSLVAFSNMPLAEEIALAYLKSTISKDPSLKVAPYEVWEIIQAFVQFSEQTAHDHDHFHLDPINQHLLDNAKSILQYNGGVDIALDYYKYMIDFVRDHLNEENHDEYMPLINRALSAYWSTALNQEYSLERHADFNEILYQMKVGNTSSILPKIKPWLTSYHEGEAFFYRLMGIHIFDYCQESSCLDFSEKLLTEALDLEESEENHLTLALLFLESHQPDKLQQLLTKVDSLFPDGEYAPMFQEIRDILSNQ